MIKRMLPGVKLSREQGTNKRQKKVPIVWLRLIYLLNYVILKLPNTNYDILEDELMKNFDEDKDLWFFG